MLGLAASAELSYTPTFHDGVKTLNQLTLLSDAVLYQPDGVTYFYGMLLFS